MTTSPEQENTRIWALKQLELAADATPAQIQAAFFGNLRRDAFMPAPAKAYAFDFLSGGPKPSGSNLGIQQAQAEMEVELRGEVDKFGEVFFGLQPADRYARWKDLWRRCHGITSFRTHLERLKPGLNLVPEDLVGAEGPHAQLAAILCALFVLRPNERARRRQDLYEELEENADFWETTTADLCAHYPKLAELEPDFVGHVADHTERAARVRQNERARVAAQKQGAFTGKGSGARLGTGGIVILMVLMGLIRMAATQSSTTRSTPLAPNFEVPQQPLFPKHEFKPPRDLGRPHDLLKPKDVEILLELEKQGIKIPGVRDRPLEK